uniref:Unkown protein n=1 Tax=Riptortus pedestris TaxID=329032 RepID=R4WE26_RIPPE|nr:unkown protein [Riptortus pedestris]
MKQVFYALVGAVLLFHVLPAIAWPESCGSQKIHDFEFGRHSFGDRLLNSVQVKRSSSFMRVLSFDENIQTKGIISYIQVIDQKRDGNSGCVYLSGGGVGFYNVILHFKSARNNGVNFQVNVYGK